MSYWICVPRNRLCDGCGTIGTPTRRGFDDRWLCAGCERTAKQQHADWLERMAPRFAAYRGAMRAGVFSDWDEGCGKREP